MRDANNDGAGEGGGSGNSDAGNVINPGSVVAPAPARGRGRPRKDGTTGPATGGTGRGGASAGTASGRKEKIKAPSHLDIGTISLGVSMFGAFIAKRTHQPALALDEQESKAIAEAAANVAKHYDIPVSPVAQAWIALAGTIGTIYFAKISALRLTKALSE